MIILGKIGQPHGHQGMVKIIPFMDKIKEFANVKKAKVISNNGKVTTVEDIKVYNRGRFLGLLSDATSRKDSEIFQGAIVIKEDGKTSSTG